MRSVILLLALASGVRGVFTQETALEYRVKAAYLYNFVKFVQWPTASTGPLAICVAGRNPFGTVLADLIRGEIVNDRSLTVRVILEPEAGCDVLFIPDGASGAYLRASHGMPILTVGESADFLEQGGVIGFVTEGPNVRFAINTEAAAQAKLRISSPLLQLAINTRGGQ